MRGEGIGALASDRALALILPVLVFVVTYIAFVPAIRGDFLQWDDDVLLLNNPDFRGFGADQFRWMFSTTLLGNYMPLTWLSYAADYVLVGLRPAGYHVTNNILHAIDAAMVFGLAHWLVRIAQPQVRESRVLAGALAAAILFGIHPLRVESVAWITERKDPLSAFFLIPSVYAYVRYARSSRVAWYAAAIALLGLSLLSKAWGLTLPVVLLVLDWYPLARWVRGASRKLILEKVPFAVVCGLSAAVTLRAQTSEVASLSGAGLLDRIAQSLYGLTFYVTKSILPTGLSPIYEHPIPFRPLTAPFLAAGASVLVVATGLWMIRASGAGRAASAAFAIYGLILLPVLGLIQVGPQLVADRYSYIACIPLAVLAGGAVARAAEVVSARAGALLACSAILVLAAMGLATWRQCAVWRNSWTLWQRALVVNPKSWTANNGIGSLYLQLGNSDQAIRHLGLAYDQKPDHIGIAINLGGALARVGRAGQSAEVFRHAASAPAATSVDLLMIGNGFESLGLRDQAIEAYRRAIEKNPDEGEAHYRLAMNLMIGPARASAKEHLIRAVELLEPSVRRGQRDAGVFVDAAIFGSACSALVKMFEEDGDHRSAVQYREKQLLLKAR